MLFRFGSALVLVVLISSIGIALEKRTLELRRAVARQHFRMDALRERDARSRHEVQRLGSPARIIEALESAELEPAVGPGVGASPRRSPPLLRWQRPATEL